jgi:hypothetical protein
LGDELHQPQTVQYFPAGYSLHPCASVYRRKEILDALGKKRKGLGTLEEVADAFFAQKGDLFTRIKPSNSRGVGNPRGGSAMETQNLLKRIT